MATWGPTEIAETEDAARWVDGGGCTLAPNDSDGHMIGLQGGQIKHFALRFPDVTIPKGATINSAYLTLEMGYQHLGAGETITAAVYGFDEDDIANFDYEDSGTHPEDHDKTTASAAWNWDENDSTGEYQSPDIGSVIEEIVARAGWASGQALGVCLYVSAADDYDQFYGIVSAGGGEVATLEIDYEEAAPTGNIIPHLIHRDFMARN